MFFYIVLTPTLPLPVYEVPAIRVNTTKSTYTFTSVKKCHNLIRSHRQTNITARKRHNTNSHAKAKDNQSKEPSNYFLIQISVKPEITLSSALQNKVQIKKNSATKGGAINNIRLQHMTSCLGVIQRHAIKSINH